MAEQPPRKKLSKEDLEKIVEAIFEVAEREVEKVRRELFLPSIDYELNVEVMDEPFYTFNISLNLRSRFSSEKLQTAARKVLERIFSRIDEIMREHGYEER